jgi:predicted ChrR family anti-sigma factor
MKMHDILDDEARERATLYALTSLTASEAITYEAHLAICEVCRREVAQLREASLGLALLAPEETPPPNLREEVLARFRSERVQSESPAAARPSQVWRQWHTSQGNDMFNAPASEGRWEPTGVAGVEVRRLFVDRTNDRVTMLVRMMAGSSYPGHRHGGAEECYVLQGDLRVGDLHMRAGDYQRAKGGSRHPVQTTEGGCLLLITSSLHDELTQT